MRQQSWAQAFQSNEENMKKFADCVIPDSELEAYLATKLTVKPDYGDLVTTKESFIVSDWLKRMAAEDADRKKRNASTKRGYGLK